VSRKAQVANIAVTGLAAKRPATRGEEGAFPIEREAHERHTRNGGLGVSFQPKSYPSWQLGLLAVEWLFLFGRNLM
jgi:hypothetical protein